MYSPGSKTAVDAIFLEESVKLQRIIFRHQIIDLYYANEDLINMQSSCVTCVLSLFTDVSFWHLVVLILSPVVFSQSVTLVSIITSTFCLEYLINNSLNMQNRMLICTCNLDKSKCSIQKLQ